MLIYKIFLFEPFPFILNVVFGGNGGIEFMLVSLALQSEVIPLNYNVIVYYKYLIIEGIRLLSIHESCNILDLSVRVIMIKYILVFVDNTNLSRSI